MWFDQSLPEKKSGILYKDRWTMTHDSLELAEKWKVREDDRAGPQRPLSLTYCMRQCMIRWGRRGSSKIQLYVSVLMGRANINPCWSIEHCIGRQGLAMPSMQKRFSASTWMRSSRQRRLELLRTTVLSAHLY